MRKTKLIVLVMVLQFFLCGCTSGDKVYELVAKLASISTPNDLGATKIVKLNWEEVQGLRGGVLRIRFITVNFWKTTLSKNWRAWPIAKIPMALIGKNIGKCVRIRYCVINDGELPLVRILKFEII